ncbi:ATP-dependent zinc metalloprotease FtsH [Ktedonosporobacter rubrisoli]|uniref:ATP-dependent zinc metalloprotease FtsH n=1 Tax=Ktedonosporobacter rubrisoli TaxID=2509675 RepID=A0A4P6K2J3_KTERU|nr:ATP-dependent zinc metalloprotease FtsH [Ktedonosporobacter rubrisoli]QBD82083.1 ATP-dependent zinc metalloprotease FtsH [Ktedonosporobacter rubrisoli]
MDIPPKDKQETTNSSAKSRNPRSKIAPRLKKRHFVIRYAIPLALVVMGVFLLALAGFRLINLAVGAGAAQEKPISEVLNMADRHQLKSVTVSSSEVLATSKSGQQYHAFKEDGQAVTEIFRRDGVAVSIDSSQHNQWVQGGVDLLLVLLVAGSMFFFIRRSGVGGQAAPFARSRAKRFNETHPNVLFKDVAGVEEAKLELQEIVEFLKYPERFTAMGARTPKGVLLVGAPGTGKTLISRAVAGEAGVAFYSVSGSEFVEMFVGVGAARVRDLFKEAKEHAPCILFIDEIDAVGRQRSNSGTGGNDEREQTLNQLLVEMDGFDKHTNVVVIAATNRPDVLDPALLRPGRFDRRVMLDKPDIRGRLAILEVHAKDKPLAANVTLEDLARQTAGFSGADLANLLNEAALLAARNGQSDIRKPELEEAILRVMAGPERKSRVITEAEKAIIAYHEVGHAIVMRSMPGADPVQKVSAIARGMALGITVQAPAEDRYLLRRSELLAKMAGAMGGRAAEEIIFGDITTGASQDIEYVTNLARRMVCEFGMTALGNIALKMDPEGTSSISAETAAKIDAEVATLIDQAYNTALTILREKKEKLIAISEHLIQVETIDGAELDAMLFAA